jgi:hypothetical protein
MGSPEALSQRIEECACLPRGGIAFPGEVATIYCNGRTVSAVSMSALLTEPNLLSCRDEAGKVTLIDRRSIRAVISQWLDSEVH